MVRRYLRPKCPDASPFLGISEYDRGPSDAEASKPNSPYTFANQTGDSNYSNDAIRYYNRVPVPPIPAIHLRGPLDAVRGSVGASGGGSGAGVMHLRVRIVSGNVDSYGTAPSDYRGRQRSIVSASTYAKTFSPLVVNKSSWKRASGATVDSDAALPHLHIALSVDDDTTVEDLALAIERSRAKNTDGEGVFSCSALFRGKVPLLFSQRVRSVLEPGNTVLAYNNSGGWSDDEGRGSECASDIDDDDGAVIDYAQNTGSGCLFVPLTEELAAEANKRFSGAAVSVMSVGNVDMSLVTKLISRAPLKARFINVLIRPELLRAFMGFCALPSELALESLLFVLDVERFRHVQPSMARLLANYIYLSYIAPQAPLRVNTSSMMRDRIPWPFLPGWEYNPWVFDEILASVGFMLKKHTLLRFERSPVGLRVLMDTPGFNPDHYIAPLRFDMDADPMAAIADQFEPDIDVVIWVNELQSDSTQMLAGLSRLTVAFREQLLQRVTAQFVDEHHALCLCDGYFRMVSHIAPLQKQRKIKKTRKLRSFFGDNPHEALLRQQLMAIVPPSSHVPAARAAAELVARKKTAEAKMRSNDNGSGASATSSVIAEQKILAMDSDSDVENEQLRGWAQEAIRRPSTSEINSRPLPSSSQPRERSWSDTDTDDECDTRDERGHVNSNGWTTDEEMPQIPRRGHRVYSDQALNRALSMIGVQHADSQDSASSDGSGSAGSSPVARTRGLDRQLHMRRTSPEPHCYSVYTAHTSSFASLGRGASQRISKFTRFERKKRADKLREFFGRMDPGTGAADTDVDAHATESVTSSIPSLSLRGAISAHCDAPLTTEQRNILVRRRRKLKALLGEQVEESVISFAPGTRLSSSSTSSASQAAAADSAVQEEHFRLSALDESLRGSACSMLTPEYTPHTSSGAMSAEPTNSAADPGRDGLGNGAELDQTRDMRDVQIRQYSKIRNVLGETAPAPCLYDRRPSAEGAEPGDGVSEEQLVRARWRRNKLVVMLGDVPTDIDTLYKTDGAARTQRPGDMPAADDSQGDEACKQDRRQRVKKLRHFFGQSLNSEAMLMQGVSRYLAQQSATAGPGGSGLAPGSPATTDESYEVVSQPSPMANDEWQARAAELDTEARQRRFLRADITSFCAPDGSVLLQENPPVRAQFWMTSSPESQESVVTDEATSHRSSLLATLRAHKASIIGTIRRAPPPGQPTSIHSGTRSRASTQSSQGSSTNGSQRNSSLSLPATRTASPGKLSLLARKIIRPEGEPAAPFVKSRLWGAGDARSHPKSPLVPPARSTSIKPLSPLPNISPNNLHASFDRCVFLNADGSPDNAKRAAHHQPPLSAPVQRTPYPPRVSSAERAAAHSAPHDHRQVVASALLSTATQGTRRRNSSKAAATKSVHWFDGPRPEAQPCAESTLPPVPLVSPGSSAAQPIAMSVPPYESAVSSSQPVSAKSSMEMSMSIILRSPSTKRQGIRSPVASPHVIASSLQPRSRFPSLPIGSPTSGPRMLLTHKASISAVGGRQLRCSAERKRPSLEEYRAAATSSRNSNNSSRGAASNCISISMCLSNRISAVDIDRSSLVVASSTRSSVSNGSCDSNNSIVTIRARRSRSFAVHRKLERATVGRKRSNTIGTGRQADSHLPQHASKQDDPNDIPRADKDTRRVQSMIMPSQYPTEPMLQRGRCATVIPLHLELQQMLECRLRAAIERRATTRRIRSPRMSDLTPVTEAHRQQLVETRMQSLAMAANALCIQSPPALADTVVPPVSRGVCDISGITRARLPSRNDSPRISAVVRRQAAVKRRNSCQLPVSLGASEKPGRLRSRSCLGRFVTPHRCSPIQPAIARYLQSANAGQHRRSPVGASGSYQRISMALLARSPIGAPHLHSGPRRSLDPRTVHKRKLSPYMESSVRRFASLGSSGLRPPEPNKK